MKIEPALFVPHFAAQRASSSQPSGAVFKVPLAGPQAAPERAATVARPPAANLIAALAAPDERRQRRQRRQGHAASLLDRLEGLAHGMVCGRIESDEVERLVAALRNGGEASDDPVLETLVEAVELRAAVEIAKLKAPKRGFRAT